MNVVSLITCTPTGKSYVGVTKNGERNPGPNFDPLRYGHGSRWCKIVRRYGRKAFTIRVLGCGYRTRKTLHEAERRFIKKYDTIWPNGYNVTTGGAGPDYGPTFCESAKRGAKRRSKNPKWLASMRRLSKNPKWLAANCAANRRLSNNPKWRSAIRAAMQRQSKNPKWIEANRAAVRRLSKNPKWIAANRAVGLRNAKNPKWRAAIRSAARRTAKNPKWLAAMQVAYERRSKDPKWRASIRASWIRRKLNLPTLKTLCVKHGCTWREAQIIQRRMAVKAR